MNRKILLSGVVASILFFSGCGITNNNTNSDNTANSSSSSSSSSSTSSTTVSGTVADGHIKGAKICIDLNNNGQCDSDEPTANSDENGSYSITTDENVSGKNIIASGGFDIGRNSEFDSKMIAYINGDNANITPITTFVNAYAKSQGVDINTAEQDVASILGINVEDVEKDPTVDDNLQKISLKLQLMAETVAKLTGKNSIDIYNELAQNASPDENLSVIVDNTFTDPNIKLAADYMMNSVDNNNIQDLNDIQQNVINIVSNAQKNNVNISDSSYIDNSISINRSYKDLNLSYSDFENKIDSLIADAEAGSDNIASVDDAKNMTSQIRDTIYEFLDPNEDNQENNTSTIAGEVLNNYNNAIKPAIDNLNDDINSSLTDIDNATKQFNKDVDNEFNESLTHLNDRLSAIADILNEHNSSDEYNETTDYNDTIEHNYSKADDGYITETFKLNDKTLTAQYYKDKASKIYVSSEPVTLSKDGEYDISLNSVSVDNNKYELNISGVVYDNNDSSKKIDLKNAILTFDLDADKYDNTLDKVKAFSNIDLNISADIITQNGTFTGDIVFNNGNKYLKGILDYSNFNGVKLDGTLKINDSTNDLLTIGNDYNKKYGDDFPPKGLVLVNGNLVTQIVEYNENGNSHDENLTSLSGEIAHCTITDDENSHTVDCDKNVTSYDISDKMVTAEINGTNVILTGGGFWYDSDTYKYEYEFEDATDKYYDIDFDTNSSEMNVTNIKVENPTTALDVVGNIKFSGKVTTPKVDVSLDLVAQSEGNNKSYHVIATDVNITNNNNVASINYLEVTQNQKAVTEYPYYSNYEINSDNSSDENTTEILLKQLNATLYDTNNNPVNISNTNLLFNASNDKASLYGNIEYLDSNLSGFIGLEKYDNDTNKSLLYLTVDRENYQPFKLGTKLYYSANEDVNSDIGIEKGDYSIYLNEEYIKSNNNITITGYDNNGVHIKISKQGDNDSDVNITDKDGNSLATFDTKSNTITYNDGSSETLY